MYFYNEITYHTRAVSGRLNCQFHGIALIFFTNGIIKNVLWKKWINSYGFWKINKLVCNERRIGYLIINWIFFPNWVITVQHYCLKKLTFLRSLIWLIFSDISRNTEILIKSNFWLGVYMANTLKAKIIQAVSLVVLRKLISEIQMSFLVPLCGHIVKIFVWK